MVCRRKGMSQTYRVLHDTFPNKHVQACADTRVQIVSLAEFVAGCQHNSGIREIHGPLEWITRIAK